MISLKDKYYPVNYYNCILYLREVYPSHVIIHDLYCGRESSDHFIRDIEIDDDSKKIYIYINASFLVKNSNELDVIDAIAQLINDPINDKSLLSQNIWSLWFDIYQICLYPRLTHLNKIYNDNSSFLPDIEINNGSLRSVEHYISNLLPQFHIVTDLYFNLSFVDTYLLCDDTRLGDIYLSKSKERFFICGKIIFLIDEINYKDISNIFECLKKGLDTLIKSGVYFFKDLRLILDFGPKSLAIGDSLNRKAYLSGGKFMEYLYA